MCKDQIILQNKQCGQNGSMCYLYKVNRLNYLLENEIPKSLTYEFDPFKTKQE